MIEEPNGEVSVKLNNNSYISITILVVIIGAVVWIKTGQFESQTVAEKNRVELATYKLLNEKDISAVSIKIDGLTELVKALGTDRYSGRDHRIFVERLKELNPTMKFPEEPK